MKISLRYALIFYIAFIIIASSYILINLNVKFNISESRKNSISIQKNQSHEIQKYLKFNFSTIEKSVRLIVSLLESSYVDYLVKEEVFGVLQKIAVQEKNMSTLSFADINDNYVSLFRTNNNKNLLYAIADSTGELHSDYINLDSENITKRVSQGFFASTRIWFTQSINSLNLEWHQVYEYYSSGNYGVGASKSVVKDGKAIGVVAIDYTLNDLSNLLINLKQGNPGVTFIYHQEKKIIASNIKETSFVNQELYKDLMANNFSLVEQYIKNKESSFIIDGLIVYKSKIYLNSHNDYYLLDIVPEKTLLYEITKNTKKQMWIAICIVIITLIVFYFSLIYIFKPIKNLENVSKKIALGEWNINLPKSRFYEISNLSSAYNTMAVKIHKSVQNLEDKVKKRTKKLNKLNEKLNEQSLTDSLTDLGNRRHFTNVMNELWKKNTTFSLAIADIDFFKRYNDSYGHLAGDDCLKHIGGFLINTSQNDATFCFRIGGEEFAIIFLNTSFTDVIDRLVALQEELKQLKIKHVSSEISPYLTLSIGLAARLTTHECWEELYKDADNLLYNAKSEGRNRIYT